MICEMCGRDNELIVSLVEGTELNVCPNCARFGKLIRKTKPEILKKERIIAAEKEIIEVIVPDYASKIRNKREGLGLKQKELAEKIAEKEALVHKLETGIVEPSIKIAKKLEKFLKIKLVEEQEQTAESFISPKREGYTLGDFLKKN